ncbi:MAG: hypothetical protein HY324_04025, partial [Chlamydiia bacterium]|nr:hypothetical protein [Chlamydiia bacterium]
NGIAFSFPLIEEKEEGVFFDVRLDRGYWDAARFSGLWNQKGWWFDTEKSHFVGSPVFFDGELRTTLPVKELCQVVPLFFPDLAKIRQFTFLEGDIDLCFLFAKGKKPLRFFSEQIEWRDGDGPLCQLKLNGSIDPSLQLELQLPKIWMDIGAFQVNGLQGQVEGSGCFSWKEKWEADFDFSSCRCIWKGLEWENQDSLHLAIDSNQKVLCTGVDVQAQGADFHLQTDFVEIDLTDFLCKFHECRLYLPPEMFFWEASEGMDCVVDLEWAPDSHFSCFMKEGEIPWQNMRYCVQNLSCSYEKDRIYLNLQYLHPETLIEVGLLALSPEEGRWKGRLQLSEEGQREKLSIDWDRLPNLGIKIEAIDGELRGVEASFCRVDQEESLI